MADRGHTGHQGRGQHRVGRTRALGRTRGSITSDHSINYGRGATQGRRLHNQRQGGIHHRSRGSRFDNPIHGFANRNNEELFWVNNQDNKSNAFCGYSHRGRGELHGNFHPSGRGTHVSSNYNQPYKFFDANNEHLLFANFEEHGRNVESFGTNYTKISYQKGPQSKQGAERGFHGHQNRRGNYNSQSTTASHDFKHVPGQPKRGATGYPRRINKPDFPKGTRSWRQDNHTPENIISEKFLDFPFLIKPEVVDLMKDFKVIFILRGLPGSGKSTIAKKLAQTYDTNAVICCADNFRFNEQGEYVWNKESLHETHQKCQKHAKQFCELGKPVVVIDNTNVKYPDVQPYLQIAKKNDYVVVLTEPKTPWKLSLQELERRNQHSLSYQKLDRMIMKYEEINPLYFAWFISPKYCTQISRYAVGVLKSCLKIAEFKDYMAIYSEKSSSKYQIRDIQYYYYMFKNQQDLHVTSCFSPKRKYLDGKPYTKSVQEYLGDISWITIIGWVITPQTFSARVSLTKQQLKLWNNDEMVPEQDMEQHSSESGNWKNEDACSFGDEEDSDDEVLECLKKWKLDCDGGNEESTMKHGAIGYEPGSNLITSHITLGKTSHTTPVQAKFDLQSLINYESSQYAYEEHNLNEGTLRNYEDNVWVVYLKNNIKFPVIFSGFYE